MKSMTGDKLLKTGAHNWSILTAYTMKIRIHELAAKEFDDAIVWYDQQSEGLGKRFEKTVKDSIRKIGNNPQWYLKESIDLYKAYIPKFP